MGRPMGPITIYLFGIASLVLGIVGLLHPDTADRTRPFWVQILFLLAIALMGLIIVAAPMVVWLSRIGRGR